MFEDFKSIQQYFLPNYFYGMKQYHRRQCAGIPDIDETKYVTARDLFKYCPDRDVCALIIEYHHSMNGLLYNEWCKKMRRNIRNRFKYCIMNRLVDWPRTVSRTKWFNILANQISQLVDQHQSHLIKPLKIEWECFRIGHDIIQDLMKAVFTYHVGLERLVDDDASGLSRCYETFLNNIDENETIYVDSLAENWFDKFFYENDMILLYASLRELHKATVRCSYAFGNRSHLIRQRDINLFNDLRLYHHLCIKYPSQYYRP